MNGGHDVGGMHGFGRINPEPETTEPVFHADWEKRVFGLASAARAVGKWNTDMSRHARERQHPADYLQHSYYENWLVGLQRLLLEAGLLTSQELASAKAIQPVSTDVLKHILKPEDVIKALSRGTSSALPADAPPRFQPGDRVRAVNRHPVGHTREPRYVRGRTGVIVEHHGCHLFPDLSAQGVRVGRHLYSVRFEAAELWGDDANANSAVYVDLWEDYLEPAG